MYISSGTDVLNCVNFSLRFQRTKQKYFFCFDLQNQKCTKRQYNYRLAFAELSA